MGRNTEEFLAWGTVFGSRGLRGELKVGFLGPDGPILKLQGLTVWFRRAAGNVPAGHRVKGTEALPQGLLLRLEDVDSLEAARPLIGSEVLVRKTDLPPPPEGSYYWFQIEGMAVFDRRNGAIGLLEDIFVTAAHPVYVVHGDRGEVMIPAVEQFVIEVDLDQRKMVVDLPEGLIPEPDEV